MARIRTIKPEFFTSLTIADLPLTARLTFIGLWTHVDDDGRAVDEPRLVRAAVWPLDDRTVTDVESDLRVLHDASLICRYQHSGRRYLAVSSWREHQRIDKPKPSKFPAPEDGSPAPLSEESSASSGAVTCEDQEIPDESPTDPGSVLDASATDPGRVPVGKEQGTGKGKESSPRPGTSPAPAADAGSAEPTDNDQREDVELVCRTLADAIEANGSKRPNITKRWRTEARLLIDKDDRTVEQVLNAIAWCQADPFWRSNVLSMPKLREKYDQLRLAARRSQANQQTAANVVDLHARQNGTSVDPVTANLMAGLALLEERDNA